MVEPRLAMGAIASMDEVRSYYRAALVALRFAEERRPTGRRFGSDADARWSAFRGDLTTADRIDLLVRDADVQWPGALGGRSVFALSSVAEDEPFGPEWVPLDPPDAEDLWRDVARQAAPTSAAKALTACASAWCLTLAPVDVGAIDANARFTVAGPSAIAAMIAAFSSRSDLDWSAQVVCVATPAAHRQLAALAIALLDGAKPAKIVDASSELTLPRSRLVISSDATPEDAARARAVSGT